MKVLSENIFLNENPLDTSLLYCTGYTYIVSNTQRKNLKLFTIFGINLAVPETRIYLRSTKCLLKIRTILTPKYKIIP